MQDMRRGGKNIVHFILFPLNLCPLQSALDKISWRMNAMQDKDARFIQQQEGDMEIRQIKTKSQDDKKSFYCM